MAVPATFARRYAAYSADAALVAAIAVPLLAWTLRDVPATFDATVAALQMRLWELAETLVYEPVGPWAMAELVSDDPALRAGIIALVELVLETLATAAVTIVAIAAVWFVGFESSARQATPGKAALGLRVTDLAGARPAFGRVLARFVAGAPSWALLHLGHAMAAWTKDRRALHDFIAGTRVEQQDDATAPLPPWARAWLAAQVIAVVALIAWVVVYYAGLVAGAAGTSF